MTFDVEVARLDLPSARAAAYLNAGTFGPMPLAADEAMRAHLDRSRDVGRIGSAGFAQWTGQMDEGRAAFANILSASPDEIALTHATTDGCNIVLWGLPFAPGDEIVTSTAEHPGLTAPLDELSRTRGVLVRAVAPAKVVESITTKTKLVAISHVLWTDGEVIDVAAIAKEAHAKGALVLVDGAQSVGAMPVDPKALGVDFYTVSGQKWLCGPSGTGALWVSSEVLARVNTPWPWYLSRSRSSAGVSDWTTARRLDSTTISMTALDGAVAALRWHSAQVAKGALAYAAEQAKSLRERLGGRAIPVKNGSLVVSFTVPGRSAAEITARLESERVLVRSIPGVEYVRASVGFWCTSSDLDRLVAHVG